ncbi:YitT family protein [Niallia oryzisoli]|uniref:YitT family protein n=1 Tax=Niallia oryzisoli TaxID=1737571 RepID=A0ABZ2CN87_9BACI
MRRYLFIYTYLLFGSIIQGMAMSLFLFPHSIPSGGGAGIAILLNHWFGISLGFSLWLANIFFLIFALHYFGFTWTVRTILAVATTSTTVTILSAGLPIPHINILFDIVAGSFFFGIGVGILIRVGASSGGMAIPAVMIASYKKWSPGKVMMAINFCIFVITSLVIDYKIVVYAIICQLISTNIIDIIYNIQLQHVKGLAPHWRKK